jgi:dipicolinate synthase subunit A
MDKKVFCIIGGDLRNVKLAEHLIKDGHVVKIFGFHDIEIDPNAIEANSLSHALEEVDVVIGPTPCSSDGETLNCVYFSTKIYLREVFSLMNSKQVFVAGLINEKVKNCAKYYDLVTADILEREEMSILNAIPTVEGAIQIAMEELPITLYHSNALVLGYGRIGKVLSKMLRGLGAKVCVEARKHSDMAWIRTYGYEAIHLNELDEHLGNFDVIFNTIPAIVLDEKQLLRIKKDCLLIDLASKPGGINFQKANEMGFKSIWALSLPGKVAPVTAAEFIKETIYNILNEII